MSQTISQRELTVMKALDKLAPASAASIAGDTDIVAETGMDIDEVRDQLDVLAAKGLTLTANSYDGHAARLNAQGRNILRDLA